MNIIVREELKAYIDPLTPEEHDALERSILAEGCRDALVLWGDILVDGHNRYGICQKHGLPFQTMQHPRFQSMEDVHLWMIDQHLGRRSVSDFQRGVLALRKREILAQRKADKLNASASSAAAASGNEADAMPAGADAAAPGAAAVDASTEPPKPFKSRSDIAKAARLSNSQVMAIEKIHSQAVPEVVAAVKSGTISLNAAAAVAMLPAEEQKAAALAGKDELKQAAKRVREVKRKPTEASEGEVKGEAQAEGDAPWADGDTSAELLALREQVATLSTENESLRQRVADLQAQLRAQLQTP
jgi:hypothetical protein